MDEIDAYCAAKLLIDQHGPGAVTYAEQRAEDLQREGDVDGHSAWTRIRDAMKKVL